MLEIKIEELNKSINKLIEVMTGINNVELPSQPAPETKQVAKPVDDVKLSQSDLEEKFMSIVRADRSKKPQLVKILSDFNAGNLSELKEGFYSEVMIKLEEL